MKKLKCGLLLSVTLSWLTLASCMQTPDAGDARRWFKEHKSTIEAAERRITAAVEEHLYASSTPSCDQLIAADPHHGVPPTSDIDPEKVDRSTRCLNARLKWGERERERMAAFRASITRVLDDRGVLGVEVSIDRESSRQEDRSLHYRCGDIDSPGKALTLPEDGILIDEYKLGWALVNLSRHGGGDDRDDYKDNNDYPMLLVRRTLRVPRMVVEYRLQLQTSKPIPSKYFELNKRRCLKQLN